MIYQHTQYWLYQASKDRRSYNLLIIIGETIRMATACIFKPAKINLLSAIFTDHSVIDMD